MEHYDRRMVTAPEWMQNFQCLAGNCPETCCQQWNVDVDPAHAESLRAIGDPELQACMDRVLRSIKVRRPGSRQADTVHRLMLLNQPNGKCPLLNEKDECRLHKKYGPYVLCDTCYFYPKTFWEIDEETRLSACLSCPECARLALLHPEPTVFSRFEAEIDPNAEWLETSLIPDPQTRELLQQREQLITALCEILQSRRFPLTQRIQGVRRFFEQLAEADTIREESIAEAAGAALHPDEVFIEMPDGRKMMRDFLEIFDPVPESLEKPVQGVSAFVRDLAGGRDGFDRLLAERYEEGSRVSDPFLTEHEYLTENFLVHCVFSDSFKQFFRYQNETQPVRGILRHESALVQAWYDFLRVLLARAALVHGEMNENIFLQTVIRGNKVWWHYPDWFGRCADRLASRTTPGS